MGFQRQGQGGGPGFPVGAFEQGVAQFGLKVADCHAHGRRHAAQGAGGGREGSAVKHGEKQFDVVAGKIQLGNLLSVNLIAADFFCQED
ncbi:hypothetical protein D3C84_706830 [compost metagenome]